MLGIGRNQYIDLMNQTRSKTKFGGFSTSLFRFVLEISFNSYEVQRELENIGMNVDFVLSLNLEMSLRIL